MKEHNEPFSTLKTMMFRKYSFQKLTQLSLGNNAVDAPACNVDEILSRDSCVSSTHLNRPIWNKESLSPP
jgi:hypothetical protein